MAITKRLTVNQITTSADGTVQIQFGKILDNNGVEISRPPHRTTIAPGADIDAVIADVLTDLATTPAGGYPPPVAADIARAKALARTAHTPAVIAKYRADQQARAHP